MADPIYHLVPARQWASAVTSKRTYFPATYEQDGFTHGTAQLDRLLAVANHFYCASTGDWTCLEMTAESLARHGIEVKFEPAAAVGDQQGRFDGTDAVLFPHIFGGIHPDAVIATYRVSRAEDGTFIRIET